MKPNSCLSSGADSQICQVTTTERDTEASHWHVFPNFRTKFPDLSNVVKFGYSLAFWALRVLNSHIKKIFPKAPHHLRMDEVDYIYICPPFERSIKMNLSSTTANIINTPICIFKLDKLVI